MDADLNEDPEERGSHTKFVPSPAPSLLITDKKLPTRRGYVLLEGRDPHDGGLWDMRISTRRMEQIKGRGWGPVKELGIIVPHILKNPRAIFQGVRDEGEAEWLCYCGLPKMAYHKDTGDQRPPYPGEVFLVFVNADRVAYHSRWEKCDPQDYRLPGDHDDRFIRRWL